MTCTAAEDPQAEILHRLARAERRQRRAERRTWTLLLVAAGLCLLGAADPIPDVLEARRFVLRDEAGGERGRWLVGHDDTSLITLMDGAGTHRATLAAGADGTTTFVMINGEGVPQLRIRMRPTGSVALELADGQRTRRARIEVGGDGDAAFVLPGKGKTSTLARLESDADAGTARLVLTEPNGRERVVLGPGENGEPELVLHPSRGAALRLGAD